MLNNEQFLESQKDCASMLGLSLSEYQKECENIIIIPRDNNEDVNYDNTILDKLGLTVDDLKLRKDYH